MSVTKDQVKAGLALLMAVAETVREAGSVPSGTVYAAVMGKVDFVGYCSMLNILKNAGLVAESGNVLTWTGPQPEASGKAVVS